MDRKVTPHNAAVPTPPATSMKLDLETKARVQRLAAARRRSAHWDTREAVEQSVDRETGH